MKVQRLRVTFGRGDQVKYITHLDLMRFWERALRRAGVPIAYSQGFNPTPKISLAAPLPVGVTSSCELMDVYLWRRISPFSFIKAVAGQLPPGFEVLAAQEVGIGLPSLQSQVRWAEYQVEVPADGDAATDVKAAIRKLLAAKSLPWQHVRDKEVRRYDLRALVDDVWLLGAAKGVTLLGMRLRCDNVATGRPEQVAAALGLRQQRRRIHRTRLILEETSPAQRARRRYSLSS
ncbi:MAG: TIGR03936 family radical SAM-associated protein [Dehalococcoidia bacterium]